MLGNNLAYYFRNKYEILGLYCAHPVNITGIQVKKADILSGEHLKKTIRNFRPDVLIHCASLTDVDFCEINKELTKQVNILGTRSVIDSIAGRATKLIYISTDSVYDGIKGHFSENDSIDPRNYYGLSKYEGELAVLKRTKSLVLRTNIFGWNIQDKRSIAEWILHELSNNKFIQGFKDAYFSSIYTFEFARILDRVIEKDLSGVYNCASRTSMSKYKFAIHLAERFNLNKSLIKPISIYEFDFKAKRGKKLTLNIDKLTDALNYTLPTITESIESFYKDFKEGVPDKIKEKKFFIRAQSQPNFIPYGRQSIDEDDIKQAVEVLRSDWITQGPKVKEFEDALCKYTGAKYAVCISSGTAALHIACLAAGIKKGDEVITSPITFVASANCILYCGGRPVFADIQEDTVNIDPEEIEKKITKRTRAIIPVHFSGCPCDLQEIHSVARKHDLIVIEDAAHALGAEYKGSKIGSCRYSDMAIFSFHPVKSITTGEGGAVLTNRKDLYERLLLFRNHGITKDEDKLRKSDGPWYYEMHELGFNYRITDFQCALGISQLKKLDTFIQRRRDIVRMYDKELAKIEEIELPIEGRNTKSAWHLYVIRIKNKRLRIKESGLRATRDEMFNYLRKKGIGVHVHYIPVYLHPYYQGLGYGKGSCPIAEDYYNRAMTLPLYPKIKISDIAYIEEVLSATLKEIKKFSQVLETK